jgi:hypothetical protein
MPKFVKLKGNDFYHQWNEEQMILINYRSGWCNINENSEGWMEAEIVEADSWADLMIKTGYCPLETDIVYKDLWISPEGKIYDGNAHTVAAEHICELLFGEDSIAMWDAERHLEQLGWIKVSQFFWNMHLADMHVWFMTQAQANVVYDWCLLHNIKYPEDIIQIQERFW